MLQKREGQHHDLPRKRRGDQASSQDSYDSAASNNENRALTEANRIQGRYQWEVVLKDDTQYPEVQVYQIAYTKRLLVAASMVGLQGCKTMFAVSSSDAWAYDKALELYEQATAKMEKDSIEGTIWPLPPRQHYLVSVLYRL